MYAERRLVCGFQMVSSPIAAGVVRRVRGALTHPLGRSNFLATLESVDMDKKLVPSLRPGSEPNQVVDPKGSVQPVCRRKFRELKKLKFADSDEARRSLPAGFVLLVGDAN